MILKVFLDFTLTLTPPGPEMTLKLILTLSDFELDPEMTFILILTMSHPNFKLTLYFTSNWTFTMNLISTHHGFEMTLLCEYHAPHELPYFEFELASK